IRLFKLNFPPDETAAGSQCTEGRRFLYPPELLGGMSVSTGLSSHDYTQPGLWEEKSEAWNTVFKGVRRRIVANSLTGTMALYNLEPQSIVALHSHPHAQYGICLEGTGEFKIADKIWKIKKGDGYY